MSTDLTQLFIELAELLKLIERSGLPEDVKHEIIMTLKYVIKGGTSARYNLERRLKRLQELLEKHAKILLENKSDIARVFNNIVGLIGIKKSFSPRPFRKRFVPPAFDEEI